MSRHLNSVEWNIYYALFNEKTELEIQEQTQEVKTVIQWIEKRLAELKERMPS